MASYESTATDMTPVGSLLHQFQFSWFCYWDGSYGLPTSTDNFVFRPPLVTSKAGIVTIQSDLDQLEQRDKITASCILDCDGSSNHRRETDDIWNTKFEKNSRNLQDFATKLRESSVTCKSEGEYSFEPILMSWEPGNELNAASLLNRLGAHNKLAESISNWQEADFEQYLDDFPIRCAVLGYLSASGDLCAFHCGRGELNPIPVLIVGKLSDDMVGGFLSALVRT